MQKMKPVAPKPELYPRLPVADRVASGMDGWTLSRGQVVRRVEYESPAMGVTIPTRVGVIEDIYRRREDGPILVDFRGDAGSDCSGLFTTTPERLKASRATVTLA